MDLEYIVYILGIIACVLIIERTIKNFKLLNDKYNELQVSLCLLNCQDSLTKTKDFFYMKNSGVDPCKSLEHIGYVDYIEDCNIFMERRHK
jgi:hypothetical protein